MKFLVAGALIFIKLTFVPTLSLLAVLFFVMVFDFLTGVWKAKMQRKVRTSEGYKRTVTKFIQYSFAILASYALAYLAGGNGNEGLKYLAPWLVDGLTGFIILIEITSIFENLYAIDSNTPISKYIFKPALSILTFQLKNNPVIKQAESLEAQTK